jgi:hypothetical protein
MRKISLKGEKQRAAKENVTISGSNHIASSVVIMFSGLTISCKTSFVSRILSQLFSPLFLIFFLHLVLLACFLR